MALMALTYMNEKKCPIDFFFLKEKEISPLFINLHPSSPEMMTLLAALEM